MAKLVRVGVLGCGAISERLHVPDVATCGDGVLVALCDANRAKAQELADRWSPDAAVYTDYKELLKKEALDAVIVTLPNVLHGPATIDALKAGCHVMVEKPMATSPAEGRKMLEAAKKAKKMLLVNQSQRLFPVHRKAKEVLDSGILGKILLVTAMFGHEGPENWSPSGTWFMNKSQARFGAMADLGVHKADLVRWLSGKEIGEISAYMGTLEKKGATVEDNFVSCLKFKDGTMGTLIASWTTKGMDANYTMFHCAKGTLRVLDIPDKPLVANLVDPECEIVFDVPPGVHRYDDSWGIDAGGAFVRAVLKKEKPFCTGADALKSLEVIFAAEESAKTGKSVKLAARK